MHPLDGDGDHYHYQARAPQYQTRYIEGRYRERDKQQERQADELNMQSLPRFHVATIVVVLEAGDVFTKQPFSVEHVDIFFLIF